MTSRDDLNPLAVGLAVLDALDPYEELAREELDVRAWRFQQLVQHGYEVEDAMAIARSHYVDLEVARSLIARPGCSSQLAMRILL
jgi:hypothetical protein